jgi:ketosteroid isomerase-like protein
VQQNRETLARTRLSSYVPTLEDNPVDMNYGRADAVLGAVLIAAFAGSTSVAAQQSPELEVSAVVDAFHTALAAGDSVAALGHLTEDVAILESGGVEDKERYRSGHLAGDMRFAAAVPRVRGALQVSVLGDVAWAYSTSITEGRMGDREINSQGAELVVLARERGAWKIKAIHWSSRARR